MFWRFGFHSASAIDGLLDKEGVTLEELLEEDEMLQECKAHNTKLVEFLSKPEMLKQLLGYIMAEDLDENKRFKYPYLACEILSCEIFSICEAIVGNMELLKDFWSLLDRPAPLNPLTASYFSKVNGVLLTKKMPEMISFIRDQPNVVPRLLTHIGSSAIADLLLKLISMEEVPEGAGIVEWLSKEGLVPTLVSRLDPALDSEVHNTAAQTLLDVIAVSYQAIGPQEPILPAGLGASIMGDQGLSVSASVGGNALVDELKSEAMMNKLAAYMLDQTTPQSATTLTNGINIIIELIRRYCSEIEQAEYQQHQYQLQPVQQRQGPPPPSEEKLKALATDLNDLLRVIGCRLMQFAELLHAPRYTESNATGTSRQNPLGSERLKTCELFAEILHLQYLYTSSPLFERLISVNTSATAPKPSDAMEESQPEGHSNSAKDDIRAPVHKTSVADELVTVTDKFIDAKILPVCLNLFFSFPWNNFLHSVVYDMIAKVFNTYSYTSTAIVSKPPSPTKEEGEEANAGGEKSAEEVQRDLDNATRNAVEQQMNAVKVIVRRLVLSIFKHGELTKRITKAQRDNDYHVAQPKGVRLGYMGHLTYISDEVCKLVEKCNEDLTQEVGDLITAEDWQDYVAGILRETKERDRQPLGGVRPNAGSQQHQVPLVTGIGGAIGGPSDDAENGNAKPFGESGKRDTDDDDDDIDPITSSDVYVGDGDVASDQFARYLCHQIVADLPDRFAGVEGSDDEEEDEQASAEWLGNFESKDFDVREAFDPDNPFPDKQSSLGDSLSTAGSVTQSMELPSSIVEESEDDAAIPDPPTDEETIPSTTTEMKSPNVFDMHGMTQALDPAPVTSSTGWADFSKMDASPRADQSPSDGTAAATPPQPPTLDVEAKDADEGTRRATGPHELEFQSPPKGVS
ncbi:hypothetical protein PhCBS80983_g03815 [Powellomyces hirtus]|uniref:SAPS domain-containing protein n=1 Tax=Powellomyces hirtus TaxID=109895 RepID=A0A507E108_9FUNG|nr:hypothetical protein PhCBS80983_g03815 [Powellomyces hirtus]